MTVKTWAWLALFSKRDLISESSTILSICPESLAEQLLPATFVHQFPGKLMKAIFYIPETILKVLQELTLMEHLLCLTDGNLLFS